MKWENLTLIILLALQQTCSIQADEDGNFEKLFEDKELAEDNFTLIGKGQRPVLVFHPSNRQRKHSQMATKMIRKKFKQEEGCDSAKDENFIIQTQTPIPPRPGFGETLAQTLYTSDSNEQDVLLQKRILSKHPHLRGAALVGTGVVVGAVGMNMYNKNRPQSGAPQADPNPVKRDVEDIILAKRVFHPHVKSAALVGGGVLLGAGGMKLYDSHTQSAAANAGTTPPTDPAPVKRDTMIKIEQTSNPFLEDLVLKEEDERDPFEKRNKHNVRGALIGVGAVTGLVATGGVVGGAVTGAMMNHRDKQKERNSNAGNPYEKRAEEDDFSSIEESSFDECELDELVEEGEYDADEQEMVEDGLFEKRLDIHEIESQALVPVKTPNKQKPNYGKIAKSAGSIAGLAAVGGVVGGAIVAHRHRKNRDSKRSLEESKSLLVKRSPVGGPRGGAKAPPKTGGGAAAPPAAKTNKGTTPTPTRTGAGGNAGLGRGTGAKPAPAGGGGGKTGKPPKPPAAKQPSARNPKPAARV